MPKTRPLLLVEDNPDDVVLTLTALEENHILNEVIVTRDGAEALDFLFCQGSHADRDPDVIPQVVFLDLKLPKISGLEVLKEIRGSERLKNLPVVVLTSSSEERDILDSYELGVNSYVRKPVDFEQFLDAAKQLGLCWLVLNEAAPITR